MLIKCPECEKEVSDKAKICFHCGYPLAHMSKQESDCDYDLKHPVLKRKHWGYDQTINKVNYYAVAMSIKNGLFLNYNEIITNNFINNIYKKCSAVTNEETTTDAIFKVMCFLGISTLTFYTLKTHYKNISENDISETLLYRQCNDIDITLLAKMIYYSQHSDYEFLAYQIEVILKQGHIDIYQEHINYAKENYQTDVKIKDKMFYEPIN